MDVRGIVNIVKQEAGIGKSIGTGFFVAPNGHILTCYHVLKNSGFDYETKTVKYKFENNPNILTATLLEVNENYDIAIFSTNTLSELNYEFSSDALSFGMHCYTAGFPKGSTKLSPSKPLFEAPIDENKKVKLNDANDIVGGFSGAPILNDEGKVIGIIVTTPESLRTEGSMLNIAHAVPSNRIIASFSTHIGFRINNNISPEKHRKIVVQYLISLQTGCEEKLKEIQSNVYPLEGLVFERETKRSHGADLVDLRTKYQPYDEKGEPSERKDDICECINGINKRVVLLGEPGCGKSVSLLKLTIEFTKRALSDQEALIPILIPLGSYKEKISPLEYVKKCMAIETDFADDIFMPSNCLFIFDALNEVATNRRADVVQFILGLERYIVSCRLLDYKREFAKQTDVARIEILDLELPKIKEAIAHQKAIGAMGNLWAAIGGNNALVNFWNNLHNESRGELFWKAPNTIKQSELLSIKEDSNTHEYEAWITMHDKGLMPLCRNPMLLRMVYNLYLKKGANLPENRGKLFEQFTDECLESELRKITIKADKTAIDLTELKENTLYMLTSLAEQIIINKQGTGIIYQEGKIILKEIFSDNAISEMEKFARDAGILSTDNDEYRFMHQLHQEYFASRLLKEAFLKSSQTADTFFNRINWWEPEGWEEAAVILAGILKTEELKSFLVWLSDVQPKLVIRCIENAGISGLTTANLDVMTKGSLLNGWLRRLEKDDGVRSRIYLGQAIDKLGDPRRGVGVVNLEGNIHPEIEWISDNSKLVLMSKYPITVSQYAAFIDADDGYINDDNWTTSIESKEWHNLRKVKPLLPELNNAPIVNVSWYDAVAFCVWLSKRCNETIRLPNEDEWIQCVNALGTLPCSVSDKDLDEMEERGKMVSVGLSVEQVRDDQIADVGLVWEWCNNIYGQMPADLGIVNPLSIPTCILKGGSWRYTLKYKTSKYRFRTHAYHIGIDIGFRVVKEVDLCKQ